LVMGENGSRAPAMRALFSACLEQGAGLLSDETAAKIRQLLSR